MIEKNVINFRSFQVEYKLKWKGYARPTWSKHSNMSCEELVRGYEQKRIQEIIGEWWKKLLVKPLKLKFIGRKSNFFEFFNFYSQEPKKSGAMFGMMLRFRMGQLNTNSRTKYAQRHQPSCWHIWKAVFAGQRSSKMILAAQAHHLSNAKTHQGNQRLSYVSVLSPPYFSYHF